MRVAITALASAVISGRANFLCSEDSALSSVSRRLPRGSAGRQTQSGPHVKTARAIWASPAIQLAYQHALDALIATMHEELLEAIGDLAAVAIRPAVTQDARVQDTTAILERAMDRWGKRWRKRFDDAAEEIASGFARKNFRMTETQMRAQLAASGFTVKFKATRASLTAYKAAVNENVALIKSIPAEYATKVQGDVWRAVTRGSDLATLSHKLQSTYGAARKRAKLIALDQNAKAKAAIERTRRLELGITKAIWTHSSAGKEPRPTHVAMNNKQFDVSVGMYDSDEGENVQPGELIYCRCSSLPVIPGLEDAYDE